MKRSRLSLRQAVLAVVGGVLAVAGAASASPLDFLAANVQSSPLFDANAGVNGEWSMPSAFTTFFDGTATAGGNLYFIDPSGFSLGGNLGWTGNGLVADLSAGGGAEGLFGPGGTFVLSGTLFDSGFAPLFTGVLISGTVSGFQVKEPDGFADALDLVADPVLTPTGGVLADGTYASMTSPYLLSFTVVGATQNGGDLVDFQSSIMSTLSMQFELTAPFIPEPASLVLTIAGAGLLLRHRRRS